MPSEPSPFAPGREQYTPHEIARLGDPWQLRVLPNRAPALGVEGPLGARPEGLYDRLNGVGAHEVIIEGRDPVTPLWRQPPELTRGALWLARERMRDLRRDQRMKTLIWFKDHGAEAGARHAWSHSQIVAFPFETPEARLDREAHQDHRSRRGRCLTCDLLYQEHTDGQRIVATSRRAIVLAAWAPRTPFELWLLPLEHQACFEESDDGLIEEVADLLRDALRRLDEALGDPALSCVLRSQADASEGRWRIEIQPVLGGSVGFQSASGCAAHGVLPEAAAAFLRAL